MEACYISKCWYQFHFASDSFTGYTAIPLQDTSRSRRVKRNCRVMLIGVDGTRIVNSMSDGATFVVNTGVDRQASKVHCKPFQVLDLCSKKRHIDLTGPHPRSSKGNVFMLTGICCFTKYLILVPIRDKSALSVARALMKNVILVFGCMEMVTQDLGREFVNEVMKNLCELLGIQELLTSAYRPSANSQIERAHRTINAVIAKTVDQNLKNWDDIIGYVAWSYNTSRHSSTTFSPYYLMFLREPRIGLDVMLDRSEPAYRNFEEYTDEVRQKMLVAYRIVSSELKASFDRAKRRYDLRVKAVQFKVGELCYYYNPRLTAGRGRKFRRLTSGPWKVIRKLNDVNYVIQWKSGKEGKIVHVDRMMKYYGNAASDKPDESGKMTNPGSSSRKADLNRPAVVHSAAIRSATSARPTLVSPMVGCFDSTGNSVRTTTSNLVRVVSWNQNQPMTVQLAARPATLSSNYFVPLGQKDTGLSVCPGSVEYNRSPSVVYVSTDSAERTFHDERITDYLGTVGKCGRIFGLPIPINSVVPEHRNLSTCYCIRSARHDDVNSVTYIPIDSAVPYTSVSTSSRRQFLQPSHVAVSSLDTNFLKRYNQGRLSNVEQVVEEINFVDCSTGSSAIMDYGNFQCGSCDEKYTLHSSFVRHVKDKHYSWPQPDGSWIPMTSEERDERISQRKRNQLPGGYKEMREKWSTDVSRTSSTSRPEEEISFVGKGDAILSTGDPPRDLPERVDSIHLGILTDQPPVVAAEWDFEEFLGPDSDITASQTLREFNETIDLYSESFALFEPEEIPRDMVPTPKQEPVLDPTLVENLLIPEYNYLANLEPISPVDATQVSKGANKSRRKRRRVVASLLTRRKRFQYRKPLRKRHLKFNFSNLCHLQTCGTDIAVSSLIENWSKDPSLEVNDALIRDSAMMLETAAQSASTVCSEIFRNIDSAGPVPEYHPLAMIGKLISPWRYPRPTSRRIRQLHSVVDCSPSTEETYIPLLVPPHGVPMVSDCYSDELEPTK